MEILIDWKILNVYYGGLVYFTVGASQYCGHEIEFKVNLNPDQAHELINAIVAKCKLEKLKIDKSRKMRFYNRDISFVKMKSFVDKGGYAWRMVVPDNDGLLPDNPECNLGFKGQLDLVDESYNSNLNPDNRH